MASTTTLLVVVIGLLIVLMLGLVAWYVWDASLASPVGSAPSPNGSNPSSPVPAPSPVPSPGGLVPAPSPVPSSLSPGGSVPAPVPSVAPSPVSTLTPPAETYAWRSGSWGGCERSGQWCNRYRSVTCVDSQGRTVPNDRCPGGSMPSVKESCNYPERNACYAGTWAPDGDFGPCTLHNIVIDGRRVTCGPSAGSQTRNIKCEGGGACDPLNMDLSLLSRTCDVPCPV